MSPVAPLPMSFTYSFWKLNTHTHSRTPFSHFPTPGGHSSRVQPQPSAMQRPPLPWPLHSSPKTAFIGRSRGRLFLTHWTWVKPQKEKAPSALPGRQGQAAAAPAGDLGPKPRLPALGTRTSALTSVSLIAFMCQWGTPLRHRVATGGRNTGHTRGGGGVHRPRQRRASLDSGQLKATSACILRRQAAGLRLALRDLLRTGQRDSQNQRAAGGGLPSSWVRFTVSGPWLAPAAADTLRIHRADLQTELGGWAGLKPAAPNVTLQL